MVALPPCTRRDPPPRCWLRCLPDQGPGQGWPGPAQRACTTRSECFRDGIRPAPTRCKCGPMACRPMCATTREPCAACLAGGQGLQGWLGLPADASAQLRSTALQVALPLSRLLRLWARRWPPRRALMPCAAHGLPPPARRSLCAPCAHAPQRAGTRCRSTSTWVRRSWTPLFGTTHGPSSP